MHAIEGCGSSIVKWAFIKNHEGALCCLRGCGKSTKFQRRLIFLCMNQIRDDLPTGVEITKDGAFKSLLLN